MKDYYYAIKYIKENYVNKCLLDVLHRKEDFQLILDDPNFGTYLNKIVSFMICNLNNH